MQHYFGKILSHPFLVCRMRSLVQLSSNCKKRRTGLFRYRTGLKPVGMNEFRNADKQSEEGGESGGQDMQPWKEDRVVARR
jgi:hypothetical protein